jgi:hypothetical protein
LRNITWQITNFLFQDEVFDGEIDRVIYSFPSSDHSALTELYLDSLKEVCGNIEIIENLPDITEIVRARRTTMIFIDDNIRELFQSEQMCNTMFVHSHHENIS